MSPKKHSKKETHHEVKKNQHISLHQKPIVRKTSRITMNEQNLDDEAVVEDTYVDNMSSIEEESEKEESVTLKRKYGEESFEENTESISKRSKVERLLGKPVTVKELNQLRETENLYHSNLFRLQVEEMLKEVNVKSTYKSLFDEWLQNFQEKLEQLSDSEMCDFSNTRWLKKMKVGIPWAVHPETIENCQFMKPSAVLVIGSYKTQCCLGPKVSVDLNVVIPKKYFHGSDFLNLKYLRKRALYLAYLAGILRYSSLADKLTYSFGGGNPLKPLLEVTPKGKAGKRILIVIRVSGNPETFKLKRFTPVLNNLRPAWFFRENISEEELPSTPHLNNAVVEDLVMGVNEEFKAKMLEEYPNLCDGIKLLKVWLHQRELDQGYGSFNGHIMSMFVLYLMHQRRLNSLMSSYQVARNTWYSLSRSDLTQDGITLAQSTSFDQPTLTDFHEHYEVVFVDVSGFCNLCGNMSKETFHKVKKESEYAIKCLDNPNINSFQALFMTPMPFCRQYDHLLCLQDPQALECSVTRHLEQQQRLDLAGNLFSQALTLILGLLREGLGQRATLGVKLPSSCSWPVDQNPPSSLSEPLVLGLALHPSFAYSILDKGPPADQPEAQRFRDFWGEKCDLRRFRDGSISEAVVWSGGATLAEKRVICRQVVEYLLGKLELVPQTHFVYAADQLEALLRPTKLQLVDSVYGTGEEASMGVLSAFDSLAKQLRQLENLPLSVSSVAGAAPVFRYTDVFPPLPACYYPNKKTTVAVGNCLLLNEQLKIVPHLVTPVEAVIQLGLSGQWPNSVGAVRRILAAFYIEIAKGLQEKNFAAQPYPDHLDVLKDGFVFRLRVACDKELACLKEQETPEGLKVYKHTPESLRLEKLLVLQPLLTGALHGLYQQYPSFGPGCGLAKRWVASQMFDNHQVPETCIELLVAHLFLSAEPFYPPGQPQLVFLRFLHLLSSSNWNTTPIILNFNEEMERNEIIEIETRFHNSRSSLPSLFVATPHDREDSLWTQEAPSLPVLVRLAQLACAALQVLEKQLLSPHIDCRVVFRPQLDLYDILIHLKPGAMSRRHETVDRPPEANPFRVVPYKHASGQCIPVVGFDPVQFYLRELREAFEEVALFFHDTYGGPVIGVLWKPDAKKEKNFKVTEVNAYKLTNKGKLVLNVEAALEDFELIGKGLVKNVVVKNK